MPKWGDPPPPLRGVRMRAVLTAAIRPQPHSNRLVTSRFSNGLYPLWTCAPETALNLPLLHAQNLPRPPTPLARSTHCQQGNVTARPRRRWRDTSFLFFPPQERIRPTVLPPPPPRSHAVATFSTAVGDPGISCENVLPSGPFGNSRQPLSINGQPLSVARQPPSVAPGGPSAFVPSNNRNSQTDGLDTLRGNNCWNRPDIRTTEHVPEDCSEIWGNMGKWGKW